MFIFIVHQIFKIHVLFVSLIHLLLQLCNRSTSDCQNKRILQALHIELEIQNLIELQSFVELLLQQNCKQSCRNLRDCKRLKAMKADEKVQYNMTVSKHITVMNFKFLSSSKILSLNEFLYTSKVQQSYSQLLSCNTHVIYQLQSIKI